LGGYRWFMMGTRFGILDPGVLEYLMQEKGYDPECLDYRVNNQPSLPVHLFGIKKVLNST